MESTSAPPPIGVLNLLPADEWPSTLQPLFEAAPPLAEALFARRPYRSYADLLHRAEQVVETLPEAPAVAVLNAHPRIGEPRDRVRAHSPVSFREQGYDRDDPIDPEAQGVDRELADLNRAYEAQFGFRFVVFVNSRARKDLVPVFRERLARPREEELRHGLRELVAIAWSRWRTLSAGGTRPGS